MRADLNALVKDTLFSRRIFFLTTCLPADEGKPKPTLPPYGSEANSNLATR